MDTNPHRQRGRDGVLLSLTLAIGALKDISGIPLMTTASGSVGTLLVVIRVRFLPFQSDVQSSHKYRTR